MRGKGKITFFALLAALILLMSSFFVEAPQKIQAQTKATPTAVHVLFHEDFVTRANRWRLFDLPGKATIDYRQSALSMIAKPANYALWTIPDNDLKLQQYDIQADLTFVSGGDDSRVGLIISYHSDSDMLVLAVSPAGDVFLGRYYFGLWNDLIPPSKVTFNGPVTLRATAGADHVLNIMVNDQPVGQTPLNDLQLDGFGLFGLTGSQGGLSALFHRLVVSENP